MLDFIALSKTSIESLLDVPVKVEIFESIDSTNSYLKRMLANDNPRLCCSEYQSQGRGRFSRTWMSPFGKNIYYSLRVTLQLPLSQLSGLSLVIGLSLIRLLKVKDLMLKWPNDLIYEEKKCAGILVEIVKTTKEETDLVIGIGLNVNEDGDSSWISLHQITGLHYDRNHIIAALTNVLLEDLANFSQQGFPAFLPTFEAYDYLLNREVTVTEKEQTLQGICRGLNRFGHLCLEDPSGNHHYLSAGTTSLKKLP